MSLNYALVTSSSLPEEVKNSSHYMEVDKAQWLDLVDYSNDLVEHNPDQKILFLIVAKGTPEQEEEDARRRANQKEKARDLEEQAEELAAEQERQRKAAAESQKAQAQLRSKSKSIFNALYGR